MTDIPFSVIIPAHNEAAVIGRCLDGIRAKAPPGHAMEIIVVANGCSDQTADIARAAAPEALVLDLAQGSKTGAINAANAVARHFPRIYLDADVECDYTTLAALAEALQDPAAMTAAPAIELDLSRADYLVRAYFRVWQRQPYARAGKGGAGCYALSRAALEQVGEFPPIIADDIWIHTRFAQECRRFIRQDSNGNPVRTIVHPPRTAREQIAVEARRQIGNRELWQTHPSPHKVHSGDAGGIAVAFRSGARMFDIVIFFSMKLAARLLARWNLMRGRQHVWTRDLSSRQP